MPLLFSVLVECVQVTGAAYFLEGEEGLAFVSTFIIVSLLIISILVLLLSPISLFSRSLKESSIK